MLLRSFFFMSLLAGAGGTAFAQSPGDLVISEFMANPAVVGDTDGEYVELYNDGTAAIDINGWILRDEGGNTHTIDNAGLPLNVPAGGFLVLARNTDINANGGVAAAYQYSGFSLNNGADQIILEDAGGTVISRVDYSDGDPFGAGVSLELSHAGAHVNGVSDETDYVAATAVFGLGDLGSPGSRGNMQIVTGIGELPDGNMPARFHLFPAFPNPFNPSTTLMLDVPAGNTIRDIEISIYNVLGQHVRTLNKTVSAPGRYRVTWDGTGAHGRFMPGGVYLAVFRFGNEILQSRRLVLAK